MKKTLMLLCALMAMSMLLSMVACDGLALDEETKGGYETIETVSEPPLASDTAENITTLPETDAITEANIETQTETAVVTETDAPTESETVTETDTLTETETVTETETEAHVHDFKVKDTSEEYLKSEATCLHAAYYFYSCECGEVGKEHFKSGSAREHVYDQKNTSSEYAKYEQTCTKRGVYYYSCVCGEMSDRTFNGDIPEGHVYDQKVMTEEYEKYAPTCTKYGLYYYSCKCGEKGDKTFNGNELGHVFNVRNTDEKYMKSPAKGSSAAVYYYSCSCGAVGTETFSGTLNKEACDHSFVQTYIYQQGIYAFMCEYCSLKVIEYGNADGSMAGGNDKVKYYITMNWSNLELEKLVIYGTGDMPDFAKDNQPMWQGCLDLVKEIVIRDGITTIGSYAFYSKGRASNVTFTIADTVKTVKAYGLYLKTSNLVLGKGVERLEAYSLGMITSSVYLPRSLKYLDGLLGVTTFYEGSRAEFLKIQMQYQNKVVTIGQYASRVDSTILDQYYVYLNADRVGDRSELLIWN